MVVRASISVQSLPSFCIDREGITIIRHSGPKRANRVSLTFLYFPLLSRTNLMASDTEMNEASPVDTLPQPNDGGRMHMSSLSSSSSISDAENERRGRSERPRMASRKPSASILVPRDHPEIEIEEEEFPPDDARAMSPRRNSADLERLGKEARQTLQE